MGLSDALQRIGAPRIEANLLELLSETQDVSTKEAVEATELRQPEVSIGMRDLQERGWVACEPIPRQGKGRPMNRYRLVADAEQMYRHYESLGRQAKTALERAMGVLQQAWTPETPDDTDGPEPVEV